MSDERAPMNMSDAQDFAERYDLSQAAVQSLVTPAASSDERACVCGDSKLFFKRNGICTNCGLGVETAFSAIPAEQEDRSDAEERWSRFPSEQFPAASSDERQARSPFDFATKVRDPFPQPHEEATRIALTATPETFPKDSYALAQWLDKALFTAVPDEDAASRPTDTGAGLIEGCRVRLTTGDTGVLIRRDYVVQLDEPDGSQGAMGGSVGVWTVQEDEIATPKPPVDEAQAEIQRLRGLLIDPGSPPWEDARALLVTELRKANLDKRADNVAAAHAELIPSDIALNLIAHASRFKVASEAAMREAAFAEADKMAETLCEGRDGTQPNLMSAYRTGVRSMALAIKPLLARLATTPGGDLLEQAAKYMRHDGLCAIIGGYGYCSCGMEAARSAISPALDGESRA
jgi:hypothetical protein